MTAEQLYNALVSLCQSYGITNEETYDRLHDAIETIHVEPEDLEAAVAAAATLSPVALVEAAGNTQAVDRRSR